MAEGGEDTDLIPRGRPRPTLQSPSQAGKGFVRHFLRSNYERHQRLTGPEKLCKLDCWECLLFASDGVGVWSHTGFANLSCLTKAATRHQSTAGHLQATVLFKTFRDTRVDVQLNEPARRATELHHEEGKKNREILKRLVDRDVHLGDTMKV